MECKKYIYNNANMSQLLIEFGAVSQLQTTLEYHIYIYIYIDPLHLAIPWTIGAIAARLLGGRGDFQIMLHVNASEVGM